MSIYFVSAIFLFLSPFNTYASQSEGGNHVPQALKQAVYHLGIVELTHEYNKQIEIGLYQATPPSNLLNRVGCIKQGQGGHLEGRYLDL
jgi:hypothetical protein